MLVDVLLYWEVVLLLLVVVVLEVVLLLLVVVFLEFVLLLLVVVFLEVVLFFWVVGLWLVVWSFLEVWLCEFGICCICEIIFGWGLKVMRMLFVLSSVFVIFVVFCRVIDDICWRRFFKVLVKIIN